MNKLSLATHPTKIFSYTSWIAMQVKSMRGLHFIFQIYWSLSSDGQIVPGQGPRLLPSSMTWHQDANYNIIFGHSTTELLPKTLVAQRYTDQLKTGRLWNEKRNIWWNL